MAMPSASRSRAASRRALSMSWPQTPNRPLGSGFGVFHRCLRMTMRSRSAAENFRVPVSPARCFAKGTTVGVFDEELPVAVGEVAPAGFAHVGDGRVV